MAPPPSSPARRRPTGTGQQPASGGARARRPSQGAPAIKALPAGAKLVCLAGPQSGSEYVLEGDEMVIGRAADNAVSIPDTSVSRKHVLLRNTGDGWAASDMGSGNGTLVNSSAIAEETPLSDGDVITLGDTELKFVTDAGGAKETGDGPAPRGGRDRSVPVRSSRAPIRSSRGRMQAVDPEAKARKRKLLIRLGAVVMLGVLVMVGWQVKKAQGEAGERSKKLKEAAVTDQCRELNQTGKNLVREGKWVEAKKKFEEVLEVCPSYGNGTVQQYIERAGKEIPSQENLDIADKSLAENKLGAAFQALEKIDPNTQQYERRDKLRTLLDTKMDSKVKDAQALLGSTGDRAKMAQLLEMANDLLVVKPDHREGTEYKKTAEEAIDRIDHPTQCQYGKNSDGSCKGAPTPWIAVQERFKSGDQSGAYAMAQGCAAKASQCRTLQDQIKDFQEKYKKLENLGPGELRALMALDRKIAGGPSALGKTIGVRITGAYVRKASNCKAKADWACAAENAKIVLDADPANVEAAEILREAKSKAKDIYMRGYSVKDSDPDEAARLFKQVIEMTSPDDEYHQKAKKQLKKGDD